MSTTSSRFVTDAAKWFGLGTAFQYLKRGRKLEEERRRRSIDPHDPELASYLRIEERELEAGGQNQPLDVDA